LIVATVLDARLDAVDEEQAPTKNEPDRTTPHHSDADDRIVARLKQLLKTPGISDKERKQVERNLRRLLEALDPEKYKAQA
jgi:tRNA C32,U32 (ribose-2'-O)-methylase TrmJ